jgi:outer membrane protein OmpA-like peptidoglycan-associated protein
MASQFRSPDVNLGETLKMQLRNILLAATIVALPATLQAQPVNGVYVGAGVGVNDLMDMNVSPGPGKVTSDLGFGVVGSVGFGYGNGLRTELELNYRNNSSHLKNGAGATIGSGTSQTYGPMVNVLYDFNIGASVVPYVGAGIGAQWMHISGNGGHSDSDIAAAAQGIVGLALPIDQNLSITAEARALGWLGNAKFSGGNGLKDPVDLSGLIGIRYAFGTTMVATAVTTQAPAPAPKAEEARTYLVFFDWDKSDLTARAKQIIADAAGASQRLAVTRIEVAGHADKSGTAVYNQALSMRRAQTVGAELVRLGVKKEAIAISAFGDTKPLVPTADGVREPQNRRVEIVLK